MQPCYCGSGKIFDGCCKPILDGIRLPNTAEELMRSRYCAYATANIAYLVETTHISTRKFYDEKSIREWATSSKWLKLEILKTEMGKESDLSGIVLFRATYQNPSQKIIVHKERSSFKKENRKWFFLEGKIE